MARRPRIPPVIPVRTLVPTILTVMALCAGVTSIRFALAERWEDAVIAIMVAALFDLLDGRVARMLKGASRFGAELDSLSDVICFGVAPALVFYLWSLNAVPGLGWAVVLLFCVCCALRLARFNILDQDASEDGTIQHFFVGVPAPAAAGLLILPMIAWFEVNWSFLQSGYLGAAYAVIIALLMISRLPTLTLKYVRIDRGLVVPVLVAIGVLVGLLAIYFWATMALIGVLYILSIPFAAVQSSRHTDPGDT